jgi:hypothetical protein
LNRIGDPLPHLFTLRSFLRRRDEVQLYSESIGNIRGENRPCDTDIGSDGETIFEPGKAGHFHAERDTREFRFRQALIDRALDLTALALLVPCQFEVRVQIDPYNALALQTVGVLAFPCRPDTVPRVCFERTVMNLLGKRDRRFDDHVGASQCLRHRFSAPRRRDRIADRQSDGAASNQLGYGYDDG